MKVTRDGWIFCGLAAAIVASTTLLIVALLKEEEKWHAFSIAHTCKKVGEMDSEVHTEVGFGVMPNGQSGSMIMTNITPKKTGWLCSDGVTYWR